MDEIAPEYDVVVLGTGKSLPRHNNTAEANTQRSHGMRSLRVTPMGPGLKQAC